MGDTTNGVPLIDAVHHPWEHFLRIGHREDYENASYSDQAESPQKGPREDPPPVPMLLDTPEADPSPTPLVQAPPMEDNNAVGEEQGVQTRRSSKRIKQTKRGTEKTPQTNNK